LAEQLSSSTEQQVNTPVIHWSRVWIIVVCAVVIVGLVVTICALLALLHPSSHRMHRVHTVTDIVPLRVQLAEMLRDEGAHHHLDLTLTYRNHGSLEVLDLVDVPNEFKLAMVPGGVTAREYPHVRQVVTLTVEPMHVFIRSELAEKGFAALRGKRIDLGPSTTASYHIAREILAFAGLQPTGSANPDGYTPVTTGPDNLHRELQRIETLRGQERERAIRALPDAAVFLAPDHSLLAKQLAQIAGYRVLPVPFAEAFCGERLNPPAEDGVHVSRWVLKPVVIPAYTYGIDPAVPAQPCPTIGVPLQLIAEDDLDPDAVVRLLETIYESPLTNVIHPIPVQDQVYDFPRHPGTERYLHRNDPVFTPEVMFKLGTLAGGIGAFLSGLLALYTLLRMRKLNRYESYYHQLGRIDLLARGVEVDPAAPIEPVALRAHLEDRLNALKNAVLRDCAEGGLRGESLMMGILALINDTREALVDMTARYEAQSSNQVTSERM
jgi:hypothetical protein